MSGGLTLKKDPKNEASLVKLPPNLSLRQRHQDLFINQFLLGFILREGCPFHFETHFVPSNRSGWWRLVPERMRQAWPSDEVSDFFNPEVHNNENWMFDARIKKRKVTFKPQKNPRRPREPCTSS